ncbi:MAG TPA: MFS transporter, partial [Limnochordia bacterium]
MAIAALGLCFSGPGQTYVIAVFVDPYLQAFGWSRSLISGLYSAATLLAGMCPLVVGRAVDRWGARRMSVAAAIALGAACLWSSAVHTALGLFVAFFLLRVFGQGAMTLIPQALVPQWFIRQRGAALSWMGLGGSLSLALFPPISDWMISEWGWESAWRVWALAVWFLYTPVAAWLIRDRPEEMGLVADGGWRPAEAGEALPPAAVDEEAWTLRQAGRTSAFWYVLIAASIPALVNTGLNFHLASVLGLQGVPASIASLVLSAFAVAGLPVRILIGYLLDRLPVHRVLAVGFAAQVPVLASVAWIHSDAAALAFGVAWGVVCTWQGLALTVIWPQYFGRAHLGSIYGASMAAMVIGSALGP